MESQDRYRIALLSAYALALNGFETLIPSPIPWLKPGLANIVTLVTLHLYGFRAAITVTLIRTLLGSLFLGTFLGPAFFLSMGGGIAGTLAMGLVTALFPGLFSPLGVSLIGAFSHNMGQLFLAYLLFIQRIEAVLVVMPVLAATGIITGAVNGVAGRYLIEAIEIKKDMALPTSGDDTA